MDKMREEFEAWFYNECCHGSVKVNYRSVVTMAAWKAWQASRAALCVELPKKEFDMGSDTFWFTWDIEDALDAAGIRYK